MTRTLKILGVAVMAALALGAVVASGASAARFHSEIEATILTADNVGEGNHVFTVNGQESACTAATFRGTSKAEDATVATSTTIILHPTYNCTFSGFNAAVDTTGCNYVINSTTNATGLLPTSIECTSGYTIKMTILSLGCTLTFEPQQTTGGTQVTNLGVGTTRDVTLHFAIKAKFTRSAFCSESFGTEGEFTGAATMKGFVDKGVTGPIDETEGAAPGKDVTATYTEGAQVGIWWE